MKGFTGFQKFLGVGLALIVLASAALIFSLVVPRAVTGAAGDGRVDLFWNGLRVGSDAGTTIDLLAAYQIPFAGATSGATTVTGALPGDTYLYFDGWSSSSADHGKVTYAVTTGTVTATTAAATTGTLNLMVISLQ